MIEWIPIISNAGFPIAVTMYLLLRFEKIIKENTEAIRGLTLYIIKLK